MADDMAVNYHRHQPHLTPEPRGRRPRRRDNCGVKFKQKQNHYTPNNKPGLVTLYYDSYFQERDDSPCSSCEHHRITLANDKNKRTKEKKQINHNTPRSRRSVNAPSDISTEEYLKIMAKKRSVPEVFSAVEHTKTKNKRRRSETCVNPSAPYQTKFIVNTVMLHPKSTPPECRPLLKHPLMQAQLRIYRCQISTNEESCCCSCNSDAMFEVMKSLYDCYKKKDCNNCNCVLCGHLPREERKLGEMRKAKERVSVGVETPSTKKKTKETMKTTPSVGPLVSLAGLTQEEKEGKLRESAKKGIALPEAQTHSEKKLIEKVTKDLGLPTPEKLRKAKAAGLLTPLEGKSPEKKEKILRDLALNGLPLPQSKTASEKKLVDKVRKDLGLPPEPKSSLERQNYVKAQSAGLITPLEGKSNAQKEKILTGLAEKGITLPEGRTSSEKALIQKIKAKVKPLPTRSMSAKFRKAKESGLLTPLEGKTSEQKEKIIRDLALSGLPIPEGKTASERKIIQKVSKDLGLPPEPKTSSERRKYNEAQAAGLITPLEGKSDAQKEKILTALAERGVPLPEGRTSSEKALIKKIKAEVKPLPSGSIIPPDKMRKAKESGLLTPLEGKTAAQKEKIIRGLAITGAPLPEGKTASDRKIIEKVRKDLGLPPEPKTSSQRQKYNDAQAAGLITPLEGKSSAQKEKILMGLAERDIPLPEGRTPSEKALIRRIKGEVKPTPSLPPEERRKLDEKTAKIMKEGKGPSDECICSLLTPESERGVTPTRAGFITPLVGKTNAEKEKILRARAAAGLPMPEGQTASERALIKKVQTEKAKAAGLLTPLEGKTSEQKENILRARAKAGLPMPEGKTASEKKLIKKVRDELGLPPEPTTQSLKSKMSRAHAAGIITPLEGKTHAQKEQILKKMAAAGIPLPVGRTATEKALIETIAAEAPAREAGLPSAKIQEARAAGLLTPLEGKTLAQKEKILKRLAAAGIPLPKGRTASEKALIKKVLAETPSARVKTSARMQQAKAAGLLTPLEGKTQEEKERILKGLAKTGVPLPEGKTVSERKLIQKVRADLGLPPEPTTRSMKERMSKAYAAGIITPLEGKTSAQKEKILKSMAAAGIPLPEGRTPSERAMINKVKAENKAARVASVLEGKTSAQKEKILKSMTEAGIPLPEGKTASEKSMIKKIKAESKAARELSMRPLGPPALSPEKRRKLDVKTAKNIKEGKGPSDECICPLLTPEADRVSKPSRKELKGAPQIAPSKLRKAQEQGLMTPLQGKSKAEKERILRGLAQAGIPLPEGQTTSEKKMIQKVRADLGLPPEPKTSSSRIKMSKAYADGIITPLEGKTHAQKAEILKQMAAAGIPLPEGRTSSEKVLIRDIAAEVPARQAGIPSAKMREARAKGLLTPLEGKTSAQQVKILKSLAKMGMPLPEGKTESEKRALEKVRAELGLPPEPTTKSLRDRMSKAYAAGIITPLEGKTNAQKEKVLKAMAAAGIPLPEGRTTSEKALIKKVATEAKGKIPSEKMRAAKAAGLLTPLEGKTQEEKERIIKGLVKSGVPLPEAKTSSEKAVIRKVRTELGLPPEPKTPSLKERIAKAQEAGIITPLEGKTRSEKEKILKNMAAAGIPLPEGRTSSEKSMIKKVKAESKAAQELKMVPLGPPALPPEKRKKLDEKTAKNIKEGKGPSDECICSLLTPESDRVSRPPPSAKELIGSTQIAPSKLRKAQEQGLMTPLQGKSKAEKERILRGLAHAGIPLPEGQTTSEKRLIQKVRDDLGLPPEPTTSSSRKNMAKAYTKGIITPLEGKTPSEKEMILKRMAAAGVPLPKGRTASEKALIKTIAAEAPSRRARVPSAKLREAKAAGLLTPLEGKTPAQKEKILKGLAKAGIPLPEAKTASEKKLLQKVRDELGLPPEPTTRSIRDRMSKAHAVGIITPLEGKTPAQKEEILKRMAAAGIPLPVGRTSSEKALIKKIAAEAPPSFISTLEGQSKSEKEKVLKSMAAAGLPLPEGKSPSERAMIRKIKKSRISEIPSDEKKKLERLQKAQERGLLTPIEGKSKSEKERIIKGLADAGLPLPEGKTPSEKAILKKITTEKIHKAKERGLLTPLKGKSKSEQEKIIKALAEAGLPIPEGTTASEKALVKKVRGEYEVTPSEKKRFKTTKSGTAHSKRIAKGMLTRSIAGIGEEVEEIVKTTTCERGCGCDKKKIRFKHSYVKIRVTSPDISSFCACPDECIPGVKGGVFTDSEGIKVTVGAATGLSLLLKPTPANTTVQDALHEPSSEESNFYSQSHISLEIASLSSNDSIESERSRSTVYIYNSETDVSVTDIKRLVCRRMYEYGTTEYNEELVRSENSYVYQSRFKNNDRPRSRRETETPSRVTLSDSYAMDEVSDSSSGSFYVIETESTDSSRSRETISVIFSPARNLDTSTSVESSSGQKSDVEEWDHSIYTYPRNNKKFESLRKETVICRISDTKEIACSAQSSSPVKRQSPGPTCPRAPNYNFNAMQGIASSKSLSNTSSSIFIVMSSSEQEETSTDSYGSTICLKMSESIPKLKTLFVSETPRKEVTRKTMNRQGLRLSTKGGKLFMEGPPKEDIGGHGKALFNRQTAAGTCQTSDIKLRIQVSGHAVSMDTTEDRPCCCAPCLRPQRSADTVGCDGGCDAVAHDSRCAADVISDLMHPSLTKDGVRGLHKEAYMNVGYSQTPSSFHTTMRVCEVPCHSPTDYHGDGGNNWDLPQTKAGESHGPCTPNTCHSGDDVNPRSNWQQHRSPSPPLQLQGSPGGGCKKSPCPMGCQLYVPPATDSPSMGPNKYSGVEFTPATMRIAKRNDRTNAQSVAVEATCSRLFNLIGTPRTDDPPFLYDGELLRNMMEQCTSTEGLIQHRKALLRQASADNIAREQLVDRNLATDATGQCACKDKSSGRGRWGRRKNHVCECPPEPEPPPDLDWGSLDSLQEAFQREQRKMKSDLTQTMSGFKLKRKRRPPPPAEEMSFEEALAFFETHPEEVPYDNCECHVDPAKEKKGKRNKRNECECPPEEPSEADAGGASSPPPGSAEISGLKFHVGGKGSGAPGLAGICCFDFLEGSTSSYVKSDSNQSSY